MKCPKCGYNSFDHLESCKKCGEDMNTHKTKFGLRSLFFGGRNVPAAPVAPVEEPESEALPGAAVVAADTTDLGFDFMGEEESDPLESPLDELLYPDLEGEFAALSAQADEDEETVTGGSADFDFTWEEESLTKDGINFGDEVTPAAAEKISWDDSSEEPSENRSSESGFSEPNLGELFLESLDQTADGSTEPAPAFLGDEDLLGKISSEVKLMESQLQEPALPDTPPLTSRIGAGIADMVILVVVFILFVAAGEVALGSGQNGSLFPSQAQLLELAAPYFLLLFALCFGYFTLFHFLIGQTPGKMFFRIRVVGEEGGGLMFSQAFLRSVGGLLSLLPAGLGFLRIIFDGERRGWNDRLANSRVIPVAGWKGLEIMDEGSLAEEG